MSPTPKRLATVIALTAAAVLGWEVLLTRLASLRYHFHFGHVAVSNGLLGIGAAGTWLAVQRPNWESRPTAWLKRLAPLFAGSLVFSWLLVYQLPVHLGTMNLWGTTSFFLFGLASLLPFMTGGAIIGLILSGWPKQAAPLYAADLLAGGLVCVLIPMALPFVGMGGSLALVLAFACAATALLTHQAWWWLVMGALMVTPFIDGAFPAPSKIDRPILHSTWTALSRVDVVEVPPDRRTIRARGTDAPIDHIPPQVEIMQDGSASTLLSDFTGHPEALDLFNTTLTSAGAQLRPGGRMLVIGFGGGDDLWAARHQGIQTIDAVDLNAPVLAAHTKVRPSWSSGLLNDNNITMEVAEGRNTLMRSTQRYDLVQLTGIDTWTALTSGAYMLAENHLYTTEAFGEMLDRLAAGGILQITRMAAEMEALRVLAQLREAHEKRSTTPFQDTCIVVGSSDHQMTTLVQPDGFSSAEIDTITRWVDTSALHLRYAPEREVDGLIQQFIRTPTPEAFVDAFPRNIRPTTDDSPYFFQFTRWTKPTVAAQTIREPTYISQGNPIFLLVQLLWTVAVATILLFGPLVGKQRPTSSTVTSFAALGLGYIMIELALMQKLTLLLGHPMRALSVTLATMLIASGLGALWSTRVRNLQWTWAIIAVLAGLFWLGVPFLVDHTVAWSAGSRSVAAGAVIAPVAFIMGVPFAWMLARIPPEQVPWAWATNALFTVIGAQLVVVSSMTLGFGFTLMGGVLAYMPALIANRWAR